MDVNRWRDLFDEFRAAEAERLERERRAREAEQAKLELDSWSRAAISWLLETAGESAKRKAEELAQHAGVRVRVSEKKRAPGRHPRAEVTYLELAKGDDKIYLYCYHEPGQVPLVHFLVTAYDAFPERRAHPRLLTLPGCRLARKRDGATRLLRVDVTGASDSNASLDVDDLVFRAFELLLRGRCARRSANVDLAAHDTHVHGTPESARA